MFPLGVAFGLLVVQSGLPWCVAAALSIAGFAGSLELLLVGMMVTLTSLVFQSYWVGGGLVGVIVGTLMPMEIEGLEFALCALFVTLTLDACRTRKQIPSLLLAAGSYAVAVVLVPGAALFVGLLLFAAALVIRYLLTRRKEAADA